MRKFNSLYEIVKKNIQDLEDRQTRLEPPTLKTGVECLDKNSVRLYPSELTVVSSPESVDIRSFLYWIGISVARSSKKSVLNIELGRVSEKVRNDRLLSMLSTIPIEQIHDADLTQEHWDYFQYSTATQLTPDIYFIDAISADLGDILYGEPVGTPLRIADIDFLIVTGIDRYITNVDNRHGAREALHILLQLSQFARRHTTPVMCSWSSLEVIGRFDPVKSYDSLSYSAGVWATADCIWALDWQNSYGLVMGEEDYEGSETELAFAELKSRGYAKKRLHMGFDRHTGRFY